MLETIEVLGGKGESMNVRSKATWLVLGFILLCSGCYASLNAGIDTPVSELSRAKSVVNATVDTGLLVDFGVGQIVISNRLGYYLNADGVQAELIGGVGEFMVEQVTPDVREGNGRGRDFRVALLMASVRPIDDGDTGTLTTLMIGPNFKKDFRVNKWFHAGLSPSVAISRLALGREVTWSLGLNFRALSWTQIFKAIGMSN